MQFLDNGPDIPNDLIHAQEQGRVIFICGAGVSMALDLPSFRGLVLKIYENLGEDPMLHLAEREGMVPNGRLFGQYDRVLRILEKRLAASNIGRAQAMRERMRRAIRDALAVPRAPDLSNHRALVELSRGSEGTLRIVTTNFDTLFERAWPGDAPAPSHAGASLPQPRTAGCEGVLHLHGRLEDADLALSETDLVLTSAEFGEAYLRSGWASRYVYDLVRAYTVVLVGYTADDPPMRYLLEVLEADRERYTDLSKVYAFAACEDGNQALEVALWRAKGVEPILHRTDDDSYAPLYDSLREWARYAADASGWRREQLLPLLAQDPSALTPAILHRAVAHLGHGDASEHLRELNPSAKWLSVLRENGVLSKTNITIGHWVAKRIDDPAMITACASVEVFDDRTRWSIERALEQSTDLAPHRRKSWELLLNTRSSAHRHELDMTWYRIAPRLKAGEAGYNARHVIASILRPKLSVRKPWSFREDNFDNQEAIETLLMIDFEIDDHVLTNEILAAWPPELQKEVELFETLMQSLLDALDEASDVGFTDGYDRAEHDVPSVALHHQNDHHHGFYPIVRVIADLWSRLLVRNSDVAMEVAAGWQASRYTLVRRLALFALNEPQFPADTAASFVLGLDDQTFWVSGAQVELMRLLVSRWDDFSPETRSNLEGRLITGLPRSLFTRSQIDDAEWASIEDNASYRRLARLRSAGKTLSAAASERLKEIERRNPRWKPSPGDRDDFQSWSESSSGPSGQPGLLENIADDRLVQEAMRIQRERYFEQSDLWRVFCQSDPDRALRGLVADLAAGRWDVEAWRPLLWSLSDNADQEIVSATVDQLIALQPDRLSDVRDSAASTLQRHRITLLTGDADNNRFWRLWDRLAEVTYDGVTVDIETAPDSDLSTRALNSAGGILVWTALEALSAMQPGSGTGLPAAFSGRLQRAIDDQSSAGLLARVQAVHSLSYLDRIAPSWTSENLVPLLAWSSREAKALWRAQGYDRIGTARLFNALKPDLLTAVSQIGLAHFEVQNLAGRLFQVVVWHQAGHSLDYDLEASDLRRALVTGDNELRDTISWQLWHLVGNVDATDADKGERWRTLVGPIFRSIWPLDAQVRSPRTSENLVRMVLDTGDAFPDAVDALAPVAAPYRIWDVSHSLRLETRHENLDRNYPKPFLKLLNVLVDPASHTIPPDLSTVLDRTRTADASVVNESSYRRLFALSQAGSA